MPDIKISGRCEDFAEFCAGDIGLNVEAFWCIKSEQVKLRINFKDDEQVVATAIWDGFLLVWESEPLRQRDRDRNLLNPLNQNREIP